MKKKYKMTMIIILILISFLLIVEVSYSNYQKSIDNTTAMIKVKTGISINYLNGNIIKTNEDTYELNFSVTNTEKDILYYYIKINNYNNIGDEVSYKLIPKDNNIEVKEESINKNNIAKRVKINGNSTQSYQLILYNKQNSFIDSELEIDLEEVDHSLKSTVLGNNEIKEDNITPFSVASTTDEGLIETETEEGSLYYFRGNVQNNYVSFGNYLWRIVKLNPDGTVLMVLNEVLDDTTSFFTDNTNNTTSFLDSDVYKVLDSWYENKLSSYDSYIASSKYCTDDNASTEENGTVYYLPENRLFQNFSPVFSCPGTINTSKIGLLTADEVMIAGGSLEENKEYYLYQDNFNSAWWTMTLNKKESGVYNYIAVSPSGTIIKDKKENEFLSVRPAITLIKKLITSGNGTKENPYTLSIQ